MGAASPGSPADQTAHPGCRGLGKHLEPSEHRIHRSRLDTRASHRRRFPSLLDHPLRHMDKARSGWSTIPRYYRQDPADWKPPKLQRTEIFPQELRRLGRSPRRYITRDHSHYPRGKEVRLGRERTFPSAPRLATLHPFANDWRANGKRLHTRTKKRRLQDNYQYDLGGPELDHSCRAKPSQQPSTSYHSQTRQGSGRKHDIAG